MALTFQFIKGSISLTLPATGFTDDLDDNLTILPIPSTASNQSVGQKSTKILDLLRITRMMTLTAEITTKADKSTLISLVQGAGINGGTIRLTYDGDDYYGYIKKVTITERTGAGAVVASGTYSTSMTRYIATIIFYEGESMGG
jgi:hypothetical protein